MDAVQRFLFEDLDIRGAIVRLGPTWHELQARRDYSPVVRDVLGELAALSALIGSQLKQPGRITLQLQGNGPIRVLVMDCDEQLRLRGMARSDASPAPAPLRTLLGDGKLILTHQTNATISPYQSHVPLEGENVAQIFEQYLARSEQIPTRLWLSANERHAGGLFLQPLPDAAARDADGWNRIQMLAQTWRTDELGLPPETLLARMFPQETLRLFPPRAVRYHCPRDEEKVLDMLRTLGREEIEEILAEHQLIAIQDDICNQEYRFGPEVLQQLFASPSRTLH